jgi:hypothetical protein
MSLLLQQRSVIRYFVLRGKSNQQIAAKLANGYGLDALCLRAVQKWARCPEIKARFWEGEQQLKEI